MTIACVTVAGCAGDTAPFNDAITAERLSEDLHYLASDEMRGRLVGTPQIASAAEWIAGRFESLGLQPAGDNGSFYQDFDLAWFSLGEGNRLSVAGGAQLRAGEGWTPANFSGTGSAVGEVVFVGFGISEPRLGYDDYDGVDVGGKIVLALEREPGVADPNSPFDGLVTAEASRTWRKTLAAQERGAVGILFVRDIHNRRDVEDWPRFHRGAWPDQPRRIERFTLGAWVDEIDIPAAQISVDLARALVAGTGQEFEQLAAGSESATGHGVMALPGAPVSMNVVVERNVTRGRNIIAMVRGEDPELSDEVVVIGAHHDHNGATEEAVFNGADDDGSGTVGVMAIAESYARAMESGDAPRRSVILAVWDAEERGLLGAWYYTINPTLPLGNTVANLNMDMIGRHHEVPADGGGRFRGLEPQSAELNSNATNILGYSRTPGLAAMVDSANSYDLELKMQYDNNESNLLRRSDHWPFLQNNVPAVWFHTGLHPDYHTPDDTADRIEYEKMTRIVRLVHQTSWELANSDVRPAVEGMRSRPRS